MAYIDTSVLVAYYHPEILSKVVQNEIVNLWQPIISNHTEVEFYSALAKKIRIDHLTKDGAEKIVRLFNSHLKSQYYKKQSVQKKHYNLAKNWLRQFDTSLRGPDALHLAISYYAGYDLITTDKGLSQAAKHLGIDCKFISK